MLDDVTAPACVICHGGLYPDEFGRQACRPCEQRVDKTLRDLAGRDGLYAKLNYRLAPGRSGDGPAVSSTPAASIPIRLEPLSLLARGGVATILQTWVEDWHEQLEFQPVRWRGNLQQQLDQAVDRLRANLSWAASKHPAFDEFAREVNKLRRDCEGQISGEPAPRRIPVACPCGTVLRVTLDTPGARCPGCETQYGHAEVLGLPMAERRAAA